MYETTNISLAAALVVLGYEKPEMDQDSQPMKVVFRFKDVDGLGVKAQQYLNHDLTIDARTYAEESWKFRNEVYELMRKKKQ